MGIVLYLIMVIALYPVPSLATLLGLAALVLGLLTLRRRRDVREAATGMETIADFAPFLSLAFAVLTVASVPGFGTNGGNWLLSLGIGGVLLSLVTAFRFSRYSVWGKRSARRERLTACREQVARERAARRFSTQAQPIAPPMMPPQPLASPSLNTAATYTAQTPPEGQPALQTVVSREDR